MDAHEDSDSEDVGIGCKKMKTRKASKKPGPKAKWSDSLVKDMVDVILNNEEHKRKLIFINIKNERNGNIYANILKEMQRRAAKRDEPVPFTVNQLRTKFKKLICECKKAALTIKSASGIKRFQDDKEYGDWFQSLYAIVKTRDACQPDLAIEPSAKGTIQSSTSTSEESPSTSQGEKNGKKLFVPVKRNKKAKKNTPTEEATKLIREALEKDPVKDLLIFMRDEAEKSREHELKLLQMQQQLAQPQTFVQPPSQLKQRFLVYQQSNLHGISGNQLHDQNQFITQEFHDGEGRYYHTL